MALEEFDGELDAPAEGGYEVFTGELDSPESGMTDGRRVDDARRIDNPANQQKPFLEDVGDRFVSMARGTAAAINPALGRLLDVTQEKKPAPSGSVLIDAPVFVGGANPNNMAENERLSRRDYAEEVDQRARIANSPSMRAPTPLSRTQQYAEANPVLAALKGDAAKTMVGTLNTPSVVAGLAGETINRVGNTMGTGEIVGRVPNMPLVDDLRGLTRDYTSSLQRKSPSQAWDDGQFGHWMMTQLAGNANSAAMSLGALFTPGAQSVILGSMGAGVAGTSYAEGDSAGASTLKGVNEAVSEMLPLSAASKLKDIVLAIPAGTRNRVLAETGKRLAAAGTAITANSLVGAIEESAAEIGGNAIDKYVSGKDKSLFEDVDRAAIVGAAFGGAMSAPSLAGLASPESNRAREFARAMNEGTLPAAGVTVDEALRTSGATLAPEATSISAAQAAATRELEARALSQQAITAVEEIQASAVADIGKAASVDEAIASAQNAVSLNGKELVDEALQAAGVNPADLNAVATQSSAETVAQVQAQAAAEQQKAAVAQATTAPTAPATQAGETTEPVKTWFGRRGDGYTTTEDAARGLRERERLAPDLDWSIEPTPDGKYRLAGYARTAQAAQPVAAPVTNPLANEILQAEQQLDAQVQRRASGTLAITGTSAPAIRVQLAQAGIPSVPINGGIEVGRANAARAETLISQSSVVPATMPVPQTPVGRAPTPPAPPPVTPRQEATRVPESAAQASGPSPTAAVATAPTVIARATEPATAAGVPAARSGAGQAPAVTGLTSQPSGTLLVTGDAKQIAGQLRQGGITKFTPTKGGILVGVTQASKAREVLASPAVSAWSERETAPVGSWIKADFKLADSQPVYQVRDMAIDDLYLPELTPDGKLQPEKRRYVEGYAARNKAGEKAPSISVIEMENGRMRVVDGHRRVMAAKAAGQTTIRALVSPLIDTADGRVEATEKNIDQSADSSQFIQDDTRTTSKRDSKDQVQAANFSIDGAPAQVQNQSDGPRPSTPESGNRTVADRARGTSEQQRIADDIAQRVSARLGRTLVLDVVAPGRGESSARNKEESATVLTAKRLFGQNVIFVRQSERVFHGLMSDAYPNTVFIDIDTDKPMMAILGHELLHQLRKNQPGIYRQLDERLTALLKNPGEFLDRIEAQYRAKGMEVPQNWDEELFADVVGDNFTDQEFWTAMAESQPRLFQRVAQAIRQFLNNILLKAKPFGTDQFMSDVRAARNAVADAMRQFSGAEVGAMADQTDGVALSVADEKSSMADVAKEVRDLVTLHNLTEDNLRYAAKIGGIPAPSIGITKVNSPFTGFGDITLIAPKAMIDPESGVPVYDRDAWTARFPQMNYKKVKAKAADAAYERMKVTRDLPIGDDGFVSQFWEQLRNANVQSPEKLAELFTRYEAPRVLYVKEVLGKEIKAPMRNVPSQMPSGHDPKLVAYWKKNGAALNRAEQSMSGAEFSESPENKAFSAEISDSIRRYAESAGMPDKADAWIDTVLENGQLGAGTRDRWIRDIETAGKKEIDRAKLGQAIDKVVSRYDPAYQRWVNSIVAPLFEEPTITLRGKEVPATLENIVDAMTVGATAGVEKSMTFSPGKVSAILGKRFKSIDEIKAARNQVVSSQVESDGKKATDELLNEYRTHVSQFYTNKDYRGNIDTWAATDDSMEALAKAGKSGSNESGIRMALQKMGFRSVDQRSIDLAKKSIDALRNAATDYFEAKPQRAVKLNEFRGAVVPKTISQESLEILRSNGIAVETYGKGEGARATAINKLANRLDKRDADIRFSLPAAQSAWEVPPDTRTDKLIFELSDMRIDLKRVQQAIKDANRQITEGFDARLAETLFPGRVARETENFLDVEVKPVLEFMAKNGVTQNELSDYMLARHAPERNAQIARVNDDMQDGGAGTNSQGVLMTTQAANDHIAALPAPKRIMLEMAAKRVDDITKGTRDLLVSSGLESQSTVDAWTSVYKNYVPLFKDEAMETPAHPIGSGMSVTGNATKRATGSTGEVTNMLAHVLMQRESAITRAEKNKVAMSLYGLALTNPNAEMWTTIRPSMPTDQIEQELLRMGVDPVEAQAGMQGVPTIRGVDPQSGKVIDRPNPMYKRLDNAIVVKVGGEDRVILFNSSNPRAVRLAQNLKGTDSRLGDIDLAGSIVGKATRYFASINTQYNPAFGMVNIVRDIGGALVNLTDTALAGKQAKILGDIPAAMVGVARDLRGDPQRTPWSDLWQQFQDDGGRTGYRDLFVDPYKRAEAVQSELDKLSKEGKLSPGKAAHAVLDFLDDFNTTLENGVRLSAYKAALDDGMSRAQAARLARELTLDFNRKGRTGRELGPLYAFFNASIQGTARTIQAIKGPAGKKIVAGGLALGVIQALMLSMAGFEDDEIPEFINARAFIIPLPGKQYIAIPLQFGLNALPNTGRVITELLMSGGKDWAEKSFNAIGELAGSFNPLGGGNIFTAHGALATVAPTILDPVVDMATNTNFAGTPISKERMPWDTRPGFTLGRESTQRAPTGQAYIGISKAINSVSGGNDFKKGLASPTPEEIKYVFTTVGGGVYRELEKAFNASALMAQGQTLKAREVPLGGRFAGEVEDIDLQRSRFFKNTKKIEGLEAEYKGFAKAGRKEEAAALMKREPLTKLYEMNDDIRRSISELNKLAATKIDDKEALKKIDAQRNKLYTILNERVRKMEKAQP